MGFHFINLTVCLLQGNKRLFKEWKIHAKLYNFLLKLHENVAFAQQETISIINLLFSLATNNEYFYIIEKQIFICYDSNHDNDHENGQNNLNKSSNNKQKAVMKCLRYVNITSQYLINMIVKIIFEWKNSLDYKNKTLFLKIIHNMLKRTLANAILCGTVTFYSLNIFLNFTRMI